MERQETARSEIFKPVRHFEKVTEYLGQVLKGLCYDSSIVKNYVLNSINHAQIG